MANYKCKYCSFKTTSKTDFINHMKSRHRDKIAAQANSHYRRSSFATVDDSLIESFVLTSVDLFVEEESSSFSFGSSNDDNSSSFSFSSDSDDE